MPIFAGCDIGSTTGKVVLIDESKTILGSSIVRSSHGPQATADRAMELALDAAKLPKDIKIDYLVSTGYGRTNVKGMNEDISEISCHARGVHHFNNSVRTVIDIGGQDCKVISLGKSGRVVDFQMNDKCSAGTGRFFEVMTRVLDSTFDQLAQAALKSKHPCQISKQCSVFAESEVISLVNNNVPFEDISAGIHDSIARRINGMVMKVGLVPDLVLTGGCAGNIALIKALESIFGCSMVKLPENPQLMGAIGAAIYALENSQQ